MSAAAALIEREYREIVPELLRREQRSAKVIALRVGSTPRAVENWKQGDNGPQVPSFIMLAREIPELKAVVRRWLELEEQHDPEAERLLNDLARYMQKRS